MYVLKFDSTSTDKMIKLTHEVYINNLIGVECDCSLGSFDLYMQEARVYKDMIIFMTKIDLTSNTVTVHPMPGQKIGSYDTMILATPGQGAIILSDGENLI